MQLEVYLSYSWWKFAIVAATHVYNHTSVRHFRKKTSQEIFLDNKPKTINLKHCTSVFLAVEHMYFFSMKFTYINLCHILN